MSRIVQDAASLARPGQRWFWLTGALFAALVIFVGFSPTFYLKGLFGAPQLSTLKLVHGMGDARVTRYGAAFLEALK